MSRSKFNRHSPFQPSLHPSHFQQIQELKQELFSSTHTCLNITKQQLEASPPRKQSGAFQFFLQNRKGQRTASPHSDVQLFLRKYFHGQTKCLTQQLISCIVKQYSHLWKESKTKQVLQHLVRSLRAVFPGSVISLQKIVEAIGENGLDGLVSGIFNEKHLSTSTTYRHENKNSSGVHLQKIKQKLRIFAQEMAKARMELQMRRLQFKQQQVQQLLCIVDTRIQELNSRHPNARQKQSIQELSNEVKIKQIQLLQAEFVISTFKSINNKLQKENRRLNEKLERFNHHTLQQLNSYRTVFHTSTRQPSLRDYRSTNHNRHKSVETVGDQSILKEPDFSSKRSLGQLFSNHGFVEGRKSKQRLSAKKPMKISIAKQQKVSQKHRIQIQT